MLYLAKNMNPYTAEGEWQDALYLLVGLTRRFASYTTITRTISGLENQVCEVGSIRFKNSATDDIFELNTEVTLDANGVGVGSFTAIELGAIELESTATLEIVDAPEGGEAVYYSSGNITTGGDDFEDDSEFRLRWIATNSVKSSNTEGGMRKALLPLCDNEPKNIIIRQNRNIEVYEDLDLHTMNIVLKTAESNETIAETILENLVDGLGLAGTTTVTLQDSENNDIDISFTKGEDLPIKFYIEIVLLDGATLAQVTKDIKNAIINHFDYGLGERIIANDFYQYINAVDGVDYVTSLEIKAPGEEPSQTITVDFDKYAEISADNIYVTEAE